MINPCLTATLTNDALSSPYLKVFRDPPLTITFGLYSTVSNSLCGVFNFQAVNYPSLTALDSTVFTMSQSSLSITVQTSDPTKAILYSIRVRAYQSLQSTNYIDMYFDVNIYDECLSTIITTPTISNPYSYTIKTPALNIGIAFSESVGFCGSFNYVMTNADGTPYDTGIFSINTVTPTVTAYVLNNALKGLY